jgi:hypothetical protein
MGMPWPWNAPWYARAKIKRHFGKCERRPVVKLGVRVGDLYRDGE